VAKANGDTDVLGAWVNPFGDHGGPAVMRPALLALLGITGLVLLIACTNVASILLARALVRRRETGLRIALGASRTRLVRQHLTESLLLAGMAGLVAIVVATWGRDLMYAFVPPAPVPISFRMALNYRVIGFTAGVTLLTAVMFGLLPALQSSRLDLVGSLKDEIGAGVRGRSRMLGTIIIAQIALSVVSLVAAGLFIRSLQGSNRVEVGFRDPKHVLLVTTDLTLAGYADSAAVVTIGRLLDRIRTVPGVEAAGAATMVPLGFGGSSSSTAEIEGYQAGPDENLSIDRSTVTPGYFEAMGIPLTRGRAFAETDRPGVTLPVAVVNEAFAERYWPGKDPIGRRLRQGGEWLTVVGIARQGKYQQLNEEPLPVVYQLLGQRNDLYLTTHIRTRGDPQLLTGALRAAFAEVGRGIPFLDAHTMAEHMGASVFAQRMAAWMLSAFGATALLLSGLGIYGMLSHLVGRRTREIGLRIALGADRGSVMGLVVGIAMRRVLIGLAVGVVLGLATGQLIRSQLLGISPRDPLVLASITLLLGVVALVASWLPARRAAHVDPMVALRTE
jgi:predicted permease